MKIDIKDYYHLYIGAKVFVFTDESITDGFLDNYRTKYPNGVYNPILTIDNYKRFLDNGYKLILRPLSDLKIEDSVEIVNSHEGMVVANCYLFIKNWVENKATMLHFETQVTFINKMRQLGFDCDGLIQEGLAIDSTTIKNNS